MEKGPMMRVTVWRMARLSPGGMTYRRTSGVLQSRLRLSTELIGIMTGRTVYKP